MQKSPRLWRRRRNNKPLLLFSCAATGYSQMGVRGRGEGGGGSGGSVGGCPPRRRRNIVSTESRDGAFFLVCAIYEGIRLRVCVFLCKHMTIQYLQLLAIYLSLSLSLFPSFNHTVSTGR